jgi:hypothetical protein
MSFIANLGFAMRSLSAQDLGVVLVIVGGVLFWLIHWWRLIRRGKSLVKSMKSLYAFSNELTLVIREEAKNNDYLRFVIALDRSLVALCGLIGDNPSWFDGDMYSEDFVDRLRSILGSIRAREMTDCRFSQIEEKFARIVSEHEAYVRKAK